MIHLVPRRLSAAVAALAFALSMGEGILAAICAPEAGMEACAEEEMLAGGMGMELPVDGARFVGAPQNASVTPHAACCPPAASGAEPVSGSDDRAPCPFTPIGVTGSCQGAASLPSTHLQLPPPSDTLRALAVPIQAPHLLLAWAPFEPPRA